MQASITSLAECVTEDLPFFAATFSATPVSKSTELPVEGLNTLEVIQVVPYRLKRVLKKFHL